MPPNPSVSVVLPVYNAERYLREAVDSILAQTFTDFELILINDGSTDGSGDICRAYAKRDPRIVLIDRPTNGGLVSALNEGLAKARAPLIARMDADDIAMPERFACQYAHMMEHSNLAVLGSAFWNIDSTGKITGQYQHTPFTPAEAKDMLSQRCPTHHPTVMMRKDAILKAGGYRAAFIHAEDYDLWLRLSQLGYDISNLPQPLLNHRTHGANVSIVHQDEQRLATVLARLSYEMRQAGEPDPLAGVETLDVGLLQKFPPSLRAHDEAILFVQHSTNLPQVTDQSALVRAWQDYLHLDPQVQRDSLLCEFLILLMKGAVRHRSWKLVGCALYEAFHRHPKRAVWIMWRRSRRKEI